MSSNTISRAATTSCAFSNTRRTTVWTCVCGTGQGTSGFGTVSPSTERLSFIFSDLLLPPGLVGRSGSFRRKERILRNRVPNRPPRSFTCCRSSRRAGTRGLPTPPCRGKQTSLPPRPSLCLETLAQHLARGLDVRFHLVLRPVLKHGDLVGFIALQGVELESLPLDRWQFSEQGQQPAVLDVPLQHRPRCVHVRPRGSCA